MGNQNNYLGHRATVSVCNLSFNWPSSTHILAWTQECARYGHKLQYLRPHEPSRIVHLLGTYRSSSVSQQFGRISFNLLIPVLSQMDPVPDLPYCFVHKKFLGAFANQLRKVILASYTSVRSFAVTGRILWNSVFRIFTETRRWISLYIKFHVIIYLSL